MKTIELQGVRKGIVSLDNEDYEWARHYDWFIRLNGHVVREFVKNGKRVVLRLDNCIIPHEKTRSLFHEDGNKLNCQKKNLVIVDRSIYMKNAVPRSKTGFKGVSMRNNRFQAHIRYLGKLYHLGSFINPEHAALAYNRAALELFGEYAYLNDVDSVEGKHKLDRIRQKDMKIQENGFKYNRMHKELTERISRIKSELNLPRSL